MVEWLEVAPWKGLKHMRYDKRSKACPDDFDPHDFGRRLRQCRLARNLSQTDLADKMGALAGWISEMETGRQRNTAVVTVMRLCRALGTTPGELLVLDPSPPPTPPPTPSPPPTPTPAP